MSSSRLLFSGFELDLDAGALLRGGVWVKLAPQPFKVLRILVESSGRVVSHDELKRALWADGTHVDFEGSLHSCVKQVRAALEDDSTAPRFIETLPRRGYRFLPTVEPAAPVVPGPRPYLSASLMLAGAAILALLAVSDRVAKPGTVSSPLTLLVKSFSNATGDESLDYLGDVLAEETLDRLSTLDPSKLVVLAPRSSERYGVQEPGPSSPSIDYELSGRILGPSRSPSLEVDLLRRSDGARLWRDRIEDGDRVSRMVAGLVPHLVAPVETSAPGSANAFSPAFEAYWKGRYLSKQADEQSLSRAERSFRDAVALRENWAAPWVGLGEIQLRRAMASGGERDYAAAAETAARAIGIESTGDAQFILALARWFGAWRWDQAGEAFQRALLRAPGLARAHHWYAYYLTGLGRHQEAILEIERARTLDPLSAEVQSDVGWFYYFGGRYLEAVEASRRTLELEPTFLLAQDCVIESYLALGRNREALTAANEFREMAGAAGEQPALVDTLDMDSFWRWRLGRAEDSPGRPNSYEAAVAALRLRREDEAVQWLRRAVEDRSLWLPVLAVDPRLSGLRTRPELQKLRVAIGLSGATQKQEGR